MLSLTQKALEEFDNPHDFERMCADILNALGYQNVVLMAPRGGGDGGKDMTFSLGHKKKGLACATLCKDIDTKFYEDFSRQKSGEFSGYLFFCNRYLTYAQKQKYTQYCQEHLHAELIVYDIEALRSLLDSRQHKKIKKRYLHLTDNGQDRRSVILTKLRAKYLLSHDGISPGMAAGLEPLPKEWVEKELEALGISWRQEVYN